MLGRITFLNQQINGYFYEILMLFLLICLLIGKGLKPLIDAYKKNKYIFWFFLFTFLTYFIDFSKYGFLENSIGFLYQLRLIYYFVFLFYVKDSISAKPVNFFIVLTAVFSFLQYLLYPDLRNLLYAGWDPHLYRMFGTYLDTYVAVTIYGLIFLYLLFQEKSFVNNVLCACYMVFILMTFSRLGYLAILITLVFVYLKNVKKVLAILGCALVVFLFIPKPWGEGVNLARTFSIESRLNDYKKAVQLWKKSPLYGIGYNRIRYVKNDLFSHSGASYHSSYMIILTTTGIVGLLLFLFSIFRLSTFTPQAVFYVLFVSLVSLGDNALLHPLVLFFLISLLSLNPSRK